MRAAKRDANENDIKARFEQRGWNVDKINGQPYDLLCWRYFNGLWEFRMIEVKSRSGRLTRSQVEAIVKGRPTCVVRDALDADAICNAADQPAYPVKQ